MTVKLVAITKPNVQGINTAEELIAYMARVSNPSNQMNNETAPKLLGYLWKNKHLSPFEMVSVTMEIETTRDIGRQILRHRSFHFQEFSQRYAEVNQFQYREPRYQDLKNRQNSKDFVIGDPTDEQLRTEWFKKINSILDLSTEAYRWAIDKGIAKEQARVMLPEGLTKSTMYMTGTLRDWLFYCLLRKKNGTQLEHSIIADECWEILKEEFPNVIQAVEKNET